MKGWKVRISGSWRRLNEAGEGGGKTLVMRLFLVDDIATVLT